VKIIGELGVTTGHNLARNDEINLYDPNDVLIDRLTYGDQTYPGTIRTQNISGQSCRESIGQDDVAAWEHSAVGDEYGSFTASTGETGSPGSYVAPSCNPCTGPGIGTQPASQNVCSSAGVTFSVVSTGTGPLAYQWQVESAPPGSGDFTNLADGLLAGVASIAGANTATITLTDLVVGGAASFRCLVSNSCGSETSAVARLAICDYAADLNCDGDADLSDLSTLLSNFGATGGATHAQGDLDGDGDVTLTDLSILLSEYGSACP
jgi:hypothetical protein